MKTLENIQDEIAMELYFIKAKFGFDGERPWKTMPDRAALTYWPEVARRYSIEVSRAALENAAKNVKWEYDDKGYPEFMPVDKLKEFMEAWNLKISESSITDENNIPKL